jgi:hypothetical protein
VSNDNLSPTMYAFYFCEKQRQILSDKESAALKAMSLDNNFEIIDEECNLRFKGGKEFDQVIFSIYISFLYLPQIVIK